MQKFRKTSVINLEVTATKVCVTLSVVPEDYEVQPQVRASLVVGAWSAVKFLLANN